RLHVGQQLGHVNLASFETDLCPVSKSEINGRARASRLRHDRLEAAPIADDLIELLLLGTLLAGAIFLDALAPVISRLGILAAVFVNPSELRKGLLTLTGLRLAGDLQIDSDEIKLVWQLEPFDATREARDRLIVRQRLERPCAGRVVLVGFRLVVVQ